MAVHHLGRYGFPKTGPARPSGQVHGDEDRAGVSAGQGRRSLFFAGRQVTALPGAPVRVDTWPHVAAPAAARVLFHRIRTGIHGFSTHLHPGSAILMRRLLLLVVLMLLVDLVIFLVAVHFSGATAVSCLQQC